MSFVPCFRYLANGRDEKSNDLLCDFFPMLFEKQQDYQQQQHLHPPLAHGGGADGAESKRGSAAHVQRIEQRRSKLIARCSSYYDSTTSGSPSRKRLDKTLGAKTVTDDPLSVSENACCCSKLKDDRRLKKRMGGRDEEREESELIPLSLMLRIGERECALTTSCEDDNNGSSSNNNNNNNNNNSVDGSRKKQKEKKDQNAHPKKTKPRTRTSRSPKIYPRNVAASIPSEALHLASNFERDLGLFKLGEEEARWFETLLKKTKNHVECEDLIKAMKMMTKNILFCIFDATAGNERLFSMTKRAHADDRDEDHASFTTYTKKREGIIQSNNDLTTNDADTVASSTSTSDKKRDSKIKVKSNVVSTHGLMNSGEIERILGYFFFSIPIFKTARHKILSNNEDSVDGRIIEPLRRNNTVTTTASPGKYSLSLSGSPEALRLKRFCDNKTSSSSDKRFLDWTQVHYNVMSFVLHMTKRLMAFCDRAKGARHHGYHAECDLCTAKVPELSFVSDQAIAYLKRDRRRPPARNTEDDDDFSLLFSSILVETRKFYFSKTNEMRFSMIKQPLSDPVRRERLSLTKVSVTLNDNNNNNAITEDSRSSLDEPFPRQVSEPTLYYSGTKKTTTDLRKVKSNDLNEGSTTKRSKTTRESKKKSSSSEEPKYIYEQTNELCRFFIYGDKDALIKTLKKYEKTSSPPRWRSKKFDRSKSSKEKIISYVKDKKTHGCPTLDVRAMLKTYYMHPLEVYKVLFSFEILKSTFPNRFAIKTINAVVKLYLILLWEP